MKNIISHSRSLLIIAGVTLSVMSCVNDNLVELSKAIQNNIQTSDTTSTTSTTSGGSNLGTNAGSNTGTSTGTSSTGTGTGTNTSTSISFSTQIKPILTKYQCANCHGSSYGNYSGASSLAKSGKLYGTMSGAKGYRRMPPGTSVTAAELTLLSAWITEGEPNN